LRFVLDQDVDARLVGTLRRAGHECWRSADAGLALAEDDDISVYADNKGAVLITHDAELTERRKVNTFGKHVRLKGQQPDAREVLEAHLDELLTELGRYESIVIEVSRSKVKVCQPQWR